MINHVSLTLHQCLLSCAISEILHLLMNLTAQNLEQSFGLNVTVKRVAGSELLHWSSNWGRTGQTCYSCAVLLLLLLLLLLVWPQHVNH